MSHAQVFNDIYRRNVWGAGSGPGSMPQTSGHYTNYLSRFLRSNRIGSVLDIGCGDWQIFHQFDWSGVIYTGIDVSSVVMSQTKTFAKPGVSFIEMDAVHDTLPQAQLLLAKDVLQHWSNRDVELFLEKLPRFQCALITNGFPTNSKRSVNADIDPGDFRPIDLSLPPFNLNGSFVFWYPADEMKFVYLWRAGR